MEESSGLLEENSGNAEHGWPRMGVAAAVRHEYGVRHERETHREAGEGQLYPGEAVNCTQAGRSTQSVRLGKCLKHKAKWSHPLFRKGENVP